MRTYYGITIEPAGRNNGEVVGEVFFSSLLDEARAIIANVEGGVS